MRRTLVNSFSRVLGQGLLQLKLAFNVLSVVVFAALAGAILLIFRWAIRHISASERRFWATVEHAPVGSDGRLMHANDTLYSTPGYGRGEMLGLPLDGIPEAEEADKLLPRASAAGRVGDARQSWKEAEARRQRTASRMASR